MMLKVIGETEETGTKITFTQIQKFSQKRPSMILIFCNLRLRELAFLNKGIEINLLDERTDTVSTSYSYEGGIVSFVEYLNRNREVVA